MNNTQFYVQLILEWLLEPGHIKTVNCQYLSSNSTLLLKQATKYFVLLLLVLGVNLQAYFHSKVGLLKFFFMIICHWTNLYLDKRVHTSIHTTSLSSSTCQLFKTYLSQCQILENLLLNYSTVTTAFKAKTHTYETVTQQHNDVGHVLCKWLGELHSIECSCWFWSCQFDIANRNYRMSNQQLRLAIQCPLSDSGILGKVLNRNYCGLTVSPAIGDLHYLLRNH